jgi:RimJ/RimL family protein N-acetyltransferase
MKEINIKNLETDRLLIKKSQMEEQYVLWNILKQDIVNRYYFPTPDRIFNKNNLRKDIYDNLVKARKIFLNQLNDWDKQLPFYERKIELINAGDDSQKFTWTIFLKNGEPIGQITVQPNNDFLNNPEIRDVGWFINPKYQRKGYATEAASCVLNFMFNDVGIKEIHTSAAIINLGSWKIMEKLGFIRTGEKNFTYFDDNGNILKNYCYFCNKELFDNKYENKKLRMVLKQ